MKTFIHTQARTHSGLTAFAIMLLCMISATTQANVIITAPTLLITGCGGFPTNSFPLGSIIIAEQSNSDISAFGTLILTAPANFEFTNAGSPSFTGGNISAVSAVLTNPKVITLTITGSGVNKRDMLTLFGISIRAIDAAAGPVNITRTGGTSVIAGDGIGAVHATLTSTAGSNFLAPSAPDVSRCNPGSLTLTASGGSSNEYMWFDQAAGGNILGINATLNIPEFTETTPFYVAEVCYIGETRMNASESFNTANTGAIAIGFDITNTSVFPMKITRISERFNANGGTGSAKAYYRMGTYEGNMLSAIGWNYSGSSPSVTITQNTTPVVFDIPDIAIPAGMTFGFYIYIPIGNNDYRTSVINNTDGNMALKAGSVVTSGLTGDFTGGQVTSASWTGAVYYQLVNCESPRTLCQGVINGYLAPAVAIAANPGDIICTGSNAIFTATPQHGGTHPTYQWKVNEIDILSATGDVYNASGLNNGDVVTCLMTSGYECAEPLTALSNAITMSVLDPSVFSLHPKDMEICQNGNASFQVVSAPAGPYQWQVSSDNGASWSKISTSGFNPEYHGYNTNTLIINGADDPINGYLYRCFSGCTLSNAAALTIGPVADPSGINSGNCDIPSNILLSASGAEEGERYFWYDALIGGSKSKSGTDHLDSTYMALNVGSTTSYYVTTVSPKGCESYPRTEVIAEIYTAPVVVTPPSHVTAPAGGNTRFDVDATGNFLNYQWQVNKGSGFENISAAGLCPAYSGWDSKTLLLTGIVPDNQGYQYRCIINGICSPEVTSEAGILTIGNEGPEGPFFHQTIGRQYSKVGTCMVATSAGEYYDNGGSYNNYSNNINQIYRTFCPNTALKAMQAKIISLDIEYAGTICKDMLSIQNGPNKDAPILWKGCGNEEISNILSLAGNYNAGIITSTHISGCLTFTFESDTSNNGSWKGWNIALSTVDYASGPSGTTNNDCVTSTSICTDVTVNSMTYGPGITSDACTGCSTSEHFVEWYKIKMATGGTIQLEVSPLGCSDLDFALFATSDCGSLGDPIRCSYATRRSPGKTGMKIGSSDLGEDLFGDQWVKELNVSAGETFYLMINENNKPNPNQYTIDWTLTNGATFDCGIALPIDMLSFEGNCDKEHTLLTWTTATETNNDRFVVLKSTNYTDFKPIGYLDGAGNSNELRQYTFTDAEKAEGVFYYKIQQVDYDGQFSFSDAIAVGCEENATPDLLVSNFQDQGLINLKFDALQGENYKLDLMDIEGRVLLTQPYHAEADQGNMDIQTSRLTPGIYQIRIISTNGMLERKVIIF